jgi:hypothetical protein
MSSFFLLLNISDNNFDEFGTKSFFSSRLFSNSCVGIKIFVPINKINILNNGNN